MTSAYLKSSSCCGPVIPRNDYLKKHFGARNWRVVSIPMTDMMQLETLFDLTKDTFQMYASEICLPIGIVRSVPGEQIFCLVSEIKFYYTSKSTGYLEVFSVN
jgi:hypothetical protein